MSRYYVITYYLCVYTGAKAAAQTKKAAGWLALINMYLY